MHKCVQSLISKQGNRLLELMGNLLYMDVLVIAWPSLPHDPYLTSWSYTFVYP